MIYHVGECEEEVSTHLAVPTRGEMVDKLLALTESIAPNEAIRTYESMVSTRGLRG